MMKSDWDNTYRRYGAVQTVILPTVFRAAKAMNRLGCSTVLDLCCGTGRHSVFLAQQGLSGFAVDASPKAVEITERKLALVDGVMWSTKVCDMRDIDLPDNSVDAVLCVWSTGHGFKSELACDVAEMFRVLKPGGNLFADFPSVEDKNYGTGTKIGVDTFLHPQLDHADVPHYYCTRSELLILLSRYSDDLRIEPIDYDDPKYNDVIKAFWIEATKT